MGQRQYSADHLVYIALMGQPGLRKATEVAILNANYLTKKLGEHYSVLYTGRNDKWPTNASSTCVR